MAIVNVSYSNDLILIENCDEFSLSIKENEKLRSIILLNNEKVKLTILDSAVIYTRKIRILNCNDSFINVSDAYVRRIELWDCKNITIIIMVEQVQFKNMNIIIHPYNEDIKISYAETIRDYVNLDFIMKY